MGGAGWAVWARAPGMIYCRLQGFVHFPRRRLPGFVRSCRCFVVFRVWGCQVVCRLVSVLSDRWWPNWARPARRTRPLASETPTRCAGGDVAVVGPIGAAFHEVELGVVGLICAVLGAGGKVSCAVSVCWACILLFVKMSSWTGPTGLPLHFMAHVRRG